MTATIRLATPGDAEDIRTIYAPIVRSTPISFETEIPGAAEMARRVESTLGFLPWLVCESGGTVLGYAYADPYRKREAYRWSVETSVYVLQDAHRRGVGRALYTSLLEILRLQGFFNAFAGITLPNPASVGFHESMGFHPLGVYRAVGYKDGVWHDVGWWQRPLRELSVDPPPPRGIEEVTSSDGWAACLASGATLVRASGRMSSE